MSQISFALRWYLVVQLFGLASLPLCSLILRHLPERGYTFSKPFGLLLTGWTFWLLTTLGWTHNTTGGILVALVLLAAAGGAIHLVGDSGTQPDRQSRKRRFSWRIVLVTETLFLLAFACWCWVRAHMPRIQTAGGEKWMEIAFLRAILRSDAFPPQDPWLSGFAISYYHFGYIIVAMVTRLSAVPAAIAFNLGIATLFALTCTGAFGLVYNLVAMDEKSQTGHHGYRLTTILGGLFGPVLVAVMGNLEALLEILHARGIGPALFWTWLDVRGINGAPTSFAEGSWVPARFFWWWQASRVVRDYTPWGAPQEVIDEFPAFSFVLGDMHPHVLGLPFVLLALALAANLYSRGSREPNPESLRWNLRLNRWTWTIQFPLELWEFAIYAVCLGSLGFLNTWDFPIYLFVVSAAYALSGLSGTPYTTRVIDCASRFAILFTALLFPGIVLYLPFWIGFQSQAGGILINLFNPTRLPHFLVMFVPLILIAVAFVYSQARQGGIRLSQVAKWTLVVSASLIGLLSLVLGVAVGLIWLGVIPPHGAMAYLAAWLRGQPIPGLENVADAHSSIARGLTSHLYNPWTTVSLIAFLVTIILTLGGIYFSNLQSQTQDSQPRVSVFVLLLLTTGALLTLSVEYVFLRDIFLTRMNTVFKFYFQAWVVWAVASGYILVRFIRQRRVVVASIALFVIALGLLYPILAISARADEYGGAPTLDGSAYLFEVQPDDFAAIAWLNENVKGEAVILEAPGGSYAYEGRVSAHTGLSAVLGWAAHELQWRGDYDEQARREPDIEALYTSVKPEEVLTLLNKYGISYIYVGPLERNRYPAAGLAKFAGLADVVYEAGAVTIYQYYPDTDGQQ
jgi:YYY domain-containing protein